MQVSFGESPAQAAPCALAERVRPLGRLIVRGPLVVQPEFLDLAVDDVEDLEPVRVVERPGNPHRSSQTCRCRSVSGEVAGASSSRGGCPHPISATSRCGTLRYTTLFSTLAMADAGM